MQKLLCQEKIGSSFTFLLDLNQTNLKSLGFDSFGNKLVLQQMSNRRDLGYILKPYKIVNPRELRQNCQICSSKFQMLINVEHQCKRCYRVICEKCSQNKIKIYQPEGHSSVHKCCQICMKEQEAISLFIKQHRLTFATSSRFADEWTRKLRRENISSKERSGEEKSSSVNIITEFSQKLYETNNNTIRFKSQSGRILNQLCASQHYSLRQFTGRMIEDVSTDLFTEKVTQTMTAIYSYLVGMPYTIQLVYVVLFLLCFCSEFDCYFIVTRYIQKIFPQFQRIEKLKKDNQLSHELKMVLDMYKVLLKKSDKQELDRLAKLLETSFFMTCIKSLLINVATVTISFYIIDDMLKNGTYIPLYKAIAVLSFLSRELLFADTNDPTTIGWEYSVLRNITVQQLKNAMVIFQKSNMKFEMDHDLFDSSEHRKLHEKYKQLESTYQKSQERFRLLEAGHNAIKKQYQQTLILMQEYKKQNMALSEEIIKNAQKIIDNEDLQKYKEQNKKLRQRNQFFLKENSNLRKEIEQLKKKQMIETTQRIIFQRIKKDYQRQIVDLKTKNEIFEIERQASDIHFNTSFIEQKIQEKNRVIAQLQGQNNKLKIQLQFYLNSKTNMPTKQESIFASNISSIQHKNSFNSQNFTNNNSLFFTALQITPKENKVSFQRYLEMGKKVNDNLKQKLVLSEKRMNQLEKQVLQLRDKNTILEKQLELNDEINHFINQIPEDINYSNSVQQLQGVIAKQTNLHKKSKLETVLSSFKKCLYEVRYRSIDAKLKENKIKQLYCSNSSHSNANRSNLSGVDNNPEIVLNEMADTIEALDWIGNEQELTEIGKSAVKKQQCLIM